MIFYTGTYTQDGAPAANPQGKGIGCFKFDLKTGKIELLQHTKQRNPSYLVISDDKKYLYAVEEMFENLKPEIYAYRIGENGELSFINSQPIAGDYACHLAIVKDRLMVASYVSGNVLSYPIQEDGSLASYNQELKHTGTGPNKERQEAAHAHMVYPFNEDQMFVLDLTLDKALAYCLDEDSKKWNAKPDLDIQIDRGAGARHMVMSSTEKTAYVLSELTGEIFIVSTNGAGMEIVQKTSIVPNEFKGEFGGAAIRIHPNGKFLYASCRGANTISIFKIDKESQKLSLVANQDSEGKTPRDFNIDPTGKWLIVANQDSNTLVTFHIDRELGILSKKSIISVATPVNICCLD